MDFSWDFPLLSLEKWYTIVMKTIRFDDGMTVMLDGETISGYRSLGCANSWDSATEGWWREISESPLGKKNVRRYHINLSRCYTLFFYPDYKVCYTVDSSD